MVNSSSLGIHNFNTGDKPTNELDAENPVGLLRKVKKALEDGENFEGECVGCGGDHGFLVCILC